MLYEYFRVFKETGGSFTDLSLDNQEEGVTLIPAITAADTLYFAQYFPVNNMYFHMGSTANATGGDITIEYWDGTNWRSAVDILDATKVSGAVLGRSGIIQWSPYIDYSWRPVNDTEDSNSPDELNSLRIYNSYWYRATFPSGLDAGTEIKEITYTFTNDSILDDIDIEINEFLTSFDSSGSKTDWIDQIITASKMLMTDLKRRGLVMNRGQILRFDDVVMPATYRTLDLIYQNLGPSYMKRRQELRVLYEEALDIERFTLDKDGNAFVSQGELSSSVKSIKR